MASGEGFLCHRVWRVRTVSFWFISIIWWWHLVLDTRYPVRYLLWFWFPHPLEPCPHSLWPLATSPQEPFSSQNARQASWGGGQCLGCDPHCSCWVKLWGKLSKKKYNLPLQVRWWSTARKPTLSESIADNDQCWQVAEEAELFLSWINLVSAVGGTNN